jgi:hypothetical protein
VVCAFPRACGRVFTGWGCAGLVAPLCGGVLTGAGAQRPALALIARGVAAPGGRSPVPAGRAGPPACGWLGPHVSAGRRTGPVRPDSSLPLVPIAPGTPALADRPLIDAGQAGGLADLFKVLGNDTRLRLLHAIHRGGRSAWATWPPQSA